MGGAGGGAPLSDVACRDLTDVENPVRAGRRFLEQELEARGAQELVDDVRLAATEMLNNAVEHGRPPLRLVVSGDGHLLRVEVHDGNPRPPVRPITSTTNMTGRGIALVEALARRWGVEPRPEGKVVWAEFAPGGEVPPEQAPVGDVDLEHILRSWQEDDLPGQRYAVTLGDVPTELLIAAKAHIDNIVRELSLAAGGAESGLPVPEHLGSLIRTVVHGFAEARDSIKRQALAAAQRGEARTRLSLHLPLSAADAGEAYLAGLDEADSYARAARLLTMEAPPAHRLFRRWYVEEVVAQLRAAAEGRPAPPVTSFEQRMLQEVGRLSVLQQGSDRAARLQRVTAALATSRTPEDVAAVVVSEGVTALEASGGSLLVPAEDGVHMAVPGVVGYRQELVDALREERLDAELPAATALRTGEAVWLESQEERDREFPALRGFEAATVSMCAVPLVVADRTLGALRFSFATRRLFDEDERAFVTALAALTAQTLLRTETYAAERKAALGLQRALLPSYVPQVPGWEVAAYYSPAGQQEAGGDFYDVLPLEDGRLVAVVGDVMGRGVEAAAAMAQVRTLIRAYAILDPRPEAVFERVDAYFAASDLAQLVTVVYFLIDPVSGEMLVGNAGHPPPLVRTPQGTEVLTTVVGTPFGVGRGPRASTSTTAQPGEVLVALTDGLIERRGEDLDEGMRRVVHLLEQGGEPSAYDLVERLGAAAAREQGYDDDSTILVLRRLPR